MIYAILIFSQREMRHSNTGFEKKHYAENPKKLSLF